MTSSSTLYLLFFICLSKNHALIITFLSVIGSCDFLVDAGQTHLPAYAKKSWLCIGDSAHPTGQTDLRIIC
jgi:hypothetical protein